MLVMAICVRCFFMPHSMGSRGFPLNHPEVGLSHPPGGCGGTIVATMFDFVFRPLRSALGIAEHEAAAPLEGAERELIDAARAIEHASESIDHHVQVIEGLATAVGPLTDSVDRLTTTMAELVALLAPLAMAQQEMAKVEHEVDRAEGFLGLRRHRKPE